MILSGGCHAVTGRPILAWSNGYMNSISITTALDLTLFRATSLRSALSSLSAGRPGDLGLATAVTLASDMCEMLGYIADSGVVVDYAGLLEPVPAPGESIH